MTSLPILRREMMVAARRPRTFFARVGAVLAGILLSLYIYFESGAVAPADLGRSLFWAFAAILSIYCLAAGFKLTADSLSSEKREGTLGLLFLTDLKGYDVVLGKLAATSLNAVYRLLAVAPLLAVPFVLGGVDWGMYGRVVLAMFDVLLFSLTAGMVASSICTREKRAGLTAAGIVVGLNLVPVAVILIPAAWNQTAPNGGPLVFSPWYGCYIAIVSGTRVLGGAPVMHRYWGALAITHAYTWVFLLTSFWVTPRSWQQRAERAARRGAGGFFDRLKSGSPAARDQWRTKCLNKNAYLWIAARDPRANIGVRLFLAVTAAAWIVGFCKAKREDWLDPGMCVVFVIALQLALKVAAARKASEQFVEDRRNHAMELLLSTPLSVRDIISGHWAALRFYFRGPLVFAVIAGLFLFVAPWKWTRSLGDASDLRTWGLLGIGDAAVVALDLWALAWVAMAKSMTSATATAAAAAAVSRILVFPSIVWSVTFSAFVAWTETATSRAGPNHDYSNVAMILWFGLSAAFDIGLALPARAKLMARFRDIAVERYGPRRVRWWNLLFGRGDGGSSAGD